MHKKQNRLNPKILSVSSATFLHPSSCYTLQEGASANSICVFSLDKDTVRTVKKSFLALVCLIGEPLNDPRVCRASLTLFNFSPSPVRVADTGLIEMSFFVGARRSC